MTGIAGRILDRVVTLAAMADLPAAPMVGRRLEMTSQSLVTGIAIGI